MRRPGIILMVILAGCAAPLWSTPPIAAVLHAGPDGLAFEGDAREFDIVVDPHDPLRLTVGYVIPKPSPNLYWLGIGTSADGGQTWQTQRLCGDPEQQTPTPDAPSCPFLGAAGISDPALAVLHDGTILYLGVMVHGYDVAQFASRFRPGQLEPESTTIIARSAFDQFDGAHLLPAPLRLYYNGKANVMQEPDTDRIHAVWAVDFRVEEAGRPNVGLPVWTSSEDGGRSWRAPQRISGHGFGDLDAPFAVGADIAKGADGRLHVTWWDGRTNQLMIVSSPDGGQRWSQPRYVADVVGRPPSAPVDFYNITRPWLELTTAGPRAGDMYLVFDHIGDGDRDVMLVRSSDSGLTWSEKLQVGHLGHQDGQDETLPRSFVDRNGTLWVLYVTYDAQWRSSGHRMHVACSQDGGETFHHAEVGSDGSPLTNVGDYSALAPTPAGMLAMWEDGRGGPPGAHRAWQATVGECPEARTDAA